MKKLLKISLMCLLLQTFGVFGYNVEGEAQQGANIVNIRNDALNIINHFPQHPQYALPLEAVDEFRAAIMQADTEAEMLEIINQFRAAVMQSHAPLFQGMEHLHDGEIGLENNNG